MEVSNGIEELAQLNFRIPKPVLQALKIEAVKDDISVQEWVTGLVIKELKSRGIEIG